MRVNEDREYAKARRELSAARTRIDELGIQLATVIDALDPETPAPTQRQRADIVDAARAILEAKRSGR